MSYCHLLALSELDKDSVPSLSCPKGGEIERGLKGWSGVEWGGGRTSSSAAAFHLPSPQQPSSHSYPYKAQVQPEPHLHMRQNRFLQTRQ